MNKKVLISSLVLLLCVAGAAFFLLKDFTQSTAGNYRNITDLRSSYNADVEIEQALENMKNSKEKAKVITRANSTGQRYIALTFDGLTDRTTIQQILDLLKKHDAKATFFVDGIQAAEDPQTLVNIRSEGQRIENYTLFGSTKMEKMPPERLIRDFCRAQRIIKVTVDKEPNLLKCNDTVYTDQLLQVANAVGFRAVVKSDVFVSAKQVNSPQTADSFVNRLRPGSILSIKLKPNANIIENEPEKTNLRPAIDKQPGLKELPQLTGTQNKEIIAMVDNLLAALKKSNYSTAFVEDVPPSVAGLFLEKAFSYIKEHAAAFFSLPRAYAAVPESAKEIKTIMTTEPALSFTFGGIANQAVVNDVLSRLAKHEIKATFFVTEVEMLRHADTLRKIISSGHEIGIAIRPKDGEAAEETVKTISRVKKMLENRFGVTTTLIKQPWGKVSDTTKEVVASLGCRLIGQSLNVVQSKHKGYTSVDQIMPEIFGKYVYSLSRGQVLYFPMDIYANPRLLGDLMETIKLRKIDNIAYVQPYDNPSNNRANDSAYRIKPVGQLLSNQEFLYQIPVSPQNVPERLRLNAQWYDHRHNFLSEASRRYIGHPEVVFEDRMLGFSKMEARRLDKSGFIHTEDNVIFLTFDDWGTDASINKILYVLRKHNVPGTFFVLTNTVMNNPNLLRAIAMQGHDIASHTDKHKPMAVRDKNGKQVPTVNKEFYLNEYAESYRKLLDVTGDVQVNGKSALTRFFRPPTLAISRDGFEAVFETGYQFIINGSCSTYDYKAENLAELVHTVKDGVYTKNGEVRKGAILILHAGDGSAYTAMALDILLTANEAKEDSNSSKFKVGRLSDYLVDGYSQANRKQTLKLASHT